MAPTNIQLRPAGRRILVAVATLVVIGLCLNYYHNSSIDHDRLQQVEERRRLASEIETAPVEYRMTIARLDDDQETAGVAKRSNASSGYRKPPARTEAPQPAINATSVAESTRTLSSSAATTTKPQALIYNYRYIVSQSDFCSAERHPNLFLLIVVYSSPQNGQRRGEIRRTWADERYMNGLNVAVVFLLGSHSDAQVLSDVRNETDAHNDIIQLDFLDDYERLSLKSVLMLGWARQFCTTPTFMMKTDDDMFVNTFSLVHYLHVLNNTGVATRRAFVCCVWEGMQVSFDDDFRWHADRGDPRVPGPAYPKYCSGSAYTMTQDLIAPLHERTRWEKLFRLEDVFTTGLLPMKLERKYIEINELYCLAMGNPGQIDRLSSDTFCVFGHVSSEQRDDLWPKIMQRYIDGKYQ